MKVFSSIILMLCTSVLVFAQQPTPKVVLKKGDIIKISQDMLSKNKQSMMGGDPQEINTAVKSLTEVEVLEELPQGYKVKKTLKSMKLDFEGFGQTTNYDSEKDKSSDNPFIKPITEKIGVPEVVEIDFDGKEKETGKDDKKGKGMMRMMGGGMSGGISSAFQLIPASAMESMGWEDTTENDGLTTRRRYKIGGVLGSLAKLYIQAQTKGTLVMNQSGMGMSTDVNVTSDEMILVNMETGRVQMQTINSKTNNKTTVNDKESPSTGTTSVTIQIE
ncbi:MAG TPA: hypothetical protein PLP14_05535 [Chitinophagaceae bacterium]|nr:hypothetical protein [Chitinophagaceae bacterium]